MTGPDGQQVLQVLPLQLPGQLDASGLGQIDLSQLDPSTLQVRLVQHFWPAGIMLPACHDIHSNTNACRRVCATHDAVLGNGTRT